VAGKLSENVKTRLRALRKEVREVGADALLVTHMPNVRYLSGFSGSEAMLLISARSQRLITDSRYTTQAAGQAGGFKVEMTTRRPEELLAIVRKTGVRRLAFEPAGLTHARYLEIKRALRGIALVRMNDAIGRLRARKDAGEARLIKRAADLALGAFNDAITKARPGLAEREFAAILEHLMRDLGSDAIPFDTIVASGPRGALPHGVASDRKMKKGELVTVDFGAACQGYQSDQTITFCLGRPKKRLKEIYDTVRAAHDLAIEAVRPGVAAKAVDKVARDHIKAAGFGDYFGHGLGHGVGLETHEGPVLAPRSKAVLEEGNVVTVEPGIYVPNFAGVRIEDMVLVTKRGARLLTASGGELREI